MARLYLVRHGRAVAGWDADRDPALDDVGAAQAEAVAERFGATAPFDLVSSPLRRARETAAPLERRWSVTARIEPAVAEIPSPATDLAARGHWLRAAMEGTWTDLGPDDSAWRDTVAATLARLSRDTVIFTHFVAINAAVGHVTADDRLVCFRPDNCSVTTFETRNGGLHLVALGDQAGTEIG
jgi:broad specificity phosphatase PhoE